LKLKKKIIVKKLSFGYYDSVLLNVRRDNPKSTNISQNNCILCF